MQYYQTRSKKIKAKDFKEANKIAYRLFLDIKRKSKRRPHVRSRYFQKEEIFLDYYWEHLFKKENWRDRFRRIKFFAAGIELIQNTTIDPFLRQDPNKKNESLHRFGGKTPDGEEFFVQIKEDKKSGQKFLISIFPK